MKLSELSTTIHLKAIRQLGHYSISHPAVPNSIQMINHQSMTCPRLPWEVLERTVSYCSGHLDDLRHLSLTCRHLRPRSQSVIFARVDLTRSKNRGVFPFITFLQANTDIKTLVLSIIIDPIQFVPSILYSLPNISSIECISSGPAKASILHLHHRSLSCFRLGTHVRSLHLLSVSLPTPFAFAQLLLALENIIHLVCMDVAIEKEGAPGPVAGAQQHLSGRLRLQSLALSSGSLNSKASVGALLFNLDLNVPSSLESLRLIESVPRPDAFFHRSTWPRLSSLVLQLHYDHEVVTNAADFLENFRGPMLREVMLELGVRSIVDVIADILLAYTGIDEDAHVLGVYSRLERILLRFSFSQITWIIDKPLKDGRNTFWTRELGKYFPALLRRHALVLKSFTVPTVGHDDAVRSIAISPNGQYIASISDDSTIILWNSSDRTMVRQWVARGHKYKDALSLEFSPDGQYLLSSGEGGKAVIWDLGEGVPVQSATTLQTFQTYFSIWSCTWSPDGSMIASGCSDGTTQLWDARTFMLLRTLRVLGRPTRVELVMFSPNGRWLLSLSPLSNYCLWDAASGMLHRMLHIQPRTTNREGLPARVAAAFHPGSTYVAAVTEPHSFQVWDVMTGKVRLVLDQLERVYDVSFSPDGKLLLAALDQQVLIWIFDADNSTVHRARFSFGGPHLASISGDSKVWRWRSIDWWGGVMYESAAAQIILSLDGKTLFSGTSDGTVTCEEIGDVPMSLPSKCRALLAFVRSGLPLLGRYLKST